MKALRKDDPCWCNSGKKYCDCHMEFDRKLDNFKRKFHKVPPRSIIKNEEQLAEAMKTFTQPEAMEQPVLMEVFSNKNKDARILKDYYHQLKQK